MHRRFATLAIALTASVGALALSVDSASARGGHGGGFGRGGHGGFMRHGGFRHGGFRHYRHFGHRHWRWRGYGWGYGYGIGGYCWRNYWGRLICTY